MATLYKSILIEQPTDGDVVFMRRFTRDPPVRAIWDATNQRFSLLPTMNLIIVGGTYAGTWALTYDPDLAGTGSNGWYNLQAGVYLMIYNNPGFGWTFFENDGASTGYNGQETFADPFNRTGTIFAPAGSPSWSGPTSMQTVTVGSSPLLIPAYTVQAWRPL